MREKRLTKQNASKSDTPTPKRPQFSKNPESPLDSIV